MKPSSTQVKLLKVGLFLGSVSGTFAIFASVPLLAYLVPVQPASTAKPLETFPVAPSPAVVKSSPQLPELIRTSPPNDSRNLPQGRSLL